VWVGEWGDIFSFQKSYIDSASEERKKKEKEKRAKKIHLEELKSPLWLVNMK